MLRELYRYSALLGFLIVCGLWTPLYVRAEAKTSIELLWAILGTAIVFGPLQLGLVVEQRRQSVRQLPALLLVLMITILLSLAIGSQYRSDGIKFPWAGTILFPCCMLILMIPLYGFSLLLSWMLRILFKVDWRLRRGQLET